MVMERLPDADAPLGYDTALACVRGCTEVLHTADAVAELCAAARGGKPLDEIVARWHAEWLRREVALDPERAAPCLRAGAPLALLGFSEESVGPAAWAEYEHALLQLRKSTLSLVGGALHGKPWRCRRCAPARALQSAGEAPREALLRALGRIEAIFADQRAAADLRAAAAAGEDPARVSAKWTAEALEGAGLERGLGASAVRAAASERAADAELLRAHARAEAARAAALAAARVPAAAASGGHAPRRYPPAAELRAAGALEPGALARVAARLEAALDEDGEDLAAEARRTRASRAAVGARWLAELCEAEGMAHDWAARALAAAAGDAAEPGARGDAMRALHAAVRRLGRLADEGGAPAGPASPGAPLASPASPHAPPPALVPRLNLRQQRISTSSTATGGTGAHCCSTRVPSRAPAPAFDPVVIANAKTNRPVRPGSARVRVRPGWSPVVVGGEADRWSSMSTLTPRSEASTAPRTPRAPLPTPRTLQLGALGRAPLGSGAR